jgi:hypothetical protein
MARYTKYVEKDDPNPAKKPPHQAWKGIGCVLMIVFPIVSWFGGDYLVSNTQLFKWVIIPGEMVIKSFKDPWIFVRLLYAGIICAILFLIFMVLTTIVNRFFGPPRYGPYDVPLDKVDNIKK